MWDQIEGWKVSKDSLKKNFFLRFVPFHLGCKCVPRNVSDDPKNGLTGEFYVKKGK